MFSSGPLFVIIVIISFHLIPVSKAGKILVGPRDQIDSDAFDKSHVFQTMKTANPDDYVVAWSTNDKSKNLIIECTVRTTGYVGFGFSDSSMMQDADIFIGGVDNTGRPYFHGYMGKDHVPVPVSDAENKKWTILAANENGDKTILRFARSYDGGLMPVELKEGGMNIIWSIGETDEIPVHHRDRGSDVIDFQPTTKEDPSTDSTQQDDVSAGGVNGKVEGPRSVNDTTVNPPMSTTTTTPSPKHSSAPKLISSLALFSTILSLVLNQMNSF